MTRALRVAWWSPLPPQKSGISDYSFDLLEELSGQLEIAAVVRDDMVDIAQAPAGVKVIGAAEYLRSRADAYDIDVYHMGNHAWFHGYLHVAAMTRPGLLVLHDVSLLDFYSGACGGIDSPVLLEEARIEDPTIEDRLPTIVVDGRKEPDRLRVLDGPSSDRGESGDDRSQREPPRRACAPLPRLDDPPHLPAGEGH